MRAMFHDYDPSIHGYRWIVLTGSDPVLETHTGGQHEEGWSATYTRWELDGDRVICTTIDDGRDCDGRLTSESVCSCPVGELAAVEVYADGDAEASEAGPLPFRVPAWRHGRSSQRDYTAEAAGY